MNISIKMRENKSEIKSDFFFQLLSTEDLNFKELYN